jgi:hypothetical protein
MPIADGRQSRGTIEWRVLGVIFVERLRRRLVRLTKAELDYLDALGINLERRITAATLSA